MRQVIFKVASSVLVVLVGMAVFRNTFEHLIPLPNSNKLDGEAGEFLQRATHQPVNWLPFAESSFLEARKKAKPVFMFVGTCYSPVARKLDEEVFTNPEIARQISRDFIAIRVDGLQNPKWMSAFLPLQRLDLGTLDGFQIWILDTHGRAIDFVGREETSSVSDRKKFRRLLIRFRDAFSDTELKGVTAEYQQKQTADIERIRSAGAVKNSGSPRFDAYSEALLNHGDPLSGGFSNHFDASFEQIDPIHAGYTDAGVKTLTPLAWSYLASVGSQDAFARSLNPLLLSPMRDILNGGFFRISAAKGLHGVEFDKVATTNAEMIEALAIAGKLFGNDQCEEQAKSAFDWLLRDLLEDNLFSACQAGDEMDQGRSLRYSFSPLKLRMHFSLSERRWLMKNMGLVAEDNHQMVPFQALPEAIAEPEWPSMLDRLRKAAGPKPQSCGKKLLDVNGHVVAKLLKVARMWGDRERINSLIPVIESLEPFRFGNDVVHTTEPAPEPGTYLGDYLAYADAMLEDYLINGRIDSFEHGTLVLTRALTLYKGQVPGEFVISQPMASTVFPQLIDVPELMDGTDESCNAQLIRLLAAYGRLHGGTPLGKRLHQTGHGCHQPGGWPYSESANRQCWSS